MQTSFIDADTERDEGQRGKRERSPAFPFIPLGKAIERAQDFAKEYRRYDARITNVGGQWGFRPKSSTALQTVAALKYFGLMEDTGGVKDERKVKLTDLARRILEDKRPGVYDKAVEEAALQPKIILEHWQKWGADRPPDAECISELRFDKDFTDEAARRFLAVYDETISFAKLPQNDTLSIQDGNKNPDENQLVVRPRGNLSAIQIDVSGDELMEGEKVLFSYTVSGNQSLRLIVRGEVDDTLLLALENQVELLKKLHELATKKALAGENSPSEKGMSNTYVDTTAVAVSGYLHENQKETD